MTMNFSRLFSLILACILFDFASATARKDEAFITVYENINYQGKSRDIYLQRGQCFPLFGEWAGEISSIKLEPDACILLYSNGECSGGPRVLDGSFKRNVGANLYFTAMNDAIESLKMCD